MANYRGVRVVSVTDDTDTIPAGFLSATLINLGEVDATITQQENDITLPAGGTFEFPFVSEKVAWDELSIDATGTEVECAYF